MMNSRRVVLAGLVSGLIYNISGMSLAGLVLGNDLQAAFERLGAPEAGLGMATLHVATRFVAGLVTVLLYVLARSRLGPGPRTAAIVGLAVWFLLYVPYLEVMYLLSVLPPSHIVVAAIWGLFEVEVAMLVGAMLYRER